uniref:Uncharacterized protein n=1 Tax=Rhabditophanes sp. KR3021 TaxID=114890 RepID=A0AC35TTE0_9BILA
MNVQEKNAWSDNRRPNLTRSQIADGERDRNAIGRVDLTQNCDQVRDDKFDRSKCESLLNRDEELSSGEGKNFDELIRTAEVPYASTTTFEKEKYMNYDQT